nr:hypothetical protein KV8917_400029 [Klebsiella variicola]
MPHYELSHYYMLQNQEISKKEKYNIDKFPNNFKLLNLLILSSNTISYYPIRTTPTDASLRI